MGPSARVKSAKSDLNDRGAQSPDCLWIVSAQSFCAKPCTFADRFGSLPGCLTGLKAHVAVCPSDVQECATASSATAQNNHLRIFVPFTLGIIETGP